MRLLTYNIHKGIGGRDRAYRLERVIDVIEQENPDFVCLQEVDRNVPRSHADNQPQKLAAFFKSAAKMYQLNVKLKRGGYGNLLLSRWPIEKRSQISLRYSWKKPRGAQLAVVRSPEGRLHIVNTHLGLSAAERNWQIRHLLEHHAYAASAHLPTLVVGDLNDWRNLLAKSGFARYGFEQVTHPISRFRSFPAFAPVGSLDKAFKRGQLWVSHARVVRTPLARAASDHLPLVVDFHLGEHEAGERTGAHGHATMAP